MNVEKLLSDLLGSGARGGAAPRRPARPGSSSGGSITDQLGGLLQGQAGSAIGGALAGGLASRLFKGKALKKLPGTALQLGGAAIVAGLAYKAYQSYQRREGTTALPGAEPVKPLSSQSAAGEVPEANGTAFLPSGEEESRARLMLSAMIAAAKADGHIDAEEERAIFGEIDTMRLDAEERGYVMDEIRRPKSIDDLVAGATTPEIAMEIYTASVLAIEADHPAERAYLDMLAARLNLPSGLAEEIQHTASGTRA